MLIAVFVDIVQDVVLSLVWLGAAVFALAVGVPLAVAGLGTALHAPVRRTLWRHGLSVAHEMPGPPSIETPPASDRG